MKPWMHFIVLWLVYGSLAAVAIHVGHDAERGLMFGFIGVTIGQELTIRRLRREHAQERKRTLEALNRAWTAKR